MQVGLFVFEKSKNKSQQNLLS